MPTVEVNEDGEMKLAPLRLKTDLVSHLAHAGRFGLIQISSTLGALLRHKNLVGLFTYRWEKIETA